MSDKKLTFKMQKSMQDEMPQSHEWYKAEFVDANTQEGNYGDMLFLNFKLLDGFLEDGETSAKGKRVSALTSPELSPTSSLYDFVKGLNGNKELDLEDEIDLTAFYGNRYKVFVTVEIPKRSKDGKKRIKVMKIKKLVVEKKGMASKKTSKPSGKVKKPSKK